MSKLKDGKPCDHPGCASHQSHPCEGCGRVGASWELTARFYCEQLAECQERLVAAQAREQDATKDLAGVLRDYRASRSVCVDPDTLRKLRRAIGVLQSDRNALDAYVEECTAELQEALAAAREEAQWNALAVVYDMIEVGHDSDMSRGWPDICISKLVEVVNAHTAALEQARASGAERMWIECACAIDSVTFAANVSPAGAWAQCSRAIRDLKPAIREADTGGENDVASDRG